MFLQSCRWKWKETFTSDFLSYQRIISPMDVFIILQLSVNDFRVRTKGRKQQNYKKLKQTRYFNNIYIAECWCEIGCTSEGSAMGQSWRTQFPVAAFSQMALFGSWITYYGSATCERLVICKCQCFCQYWSVLS